MKRSSSTPAQSRRRDLISWTVALDAGVTAYGARRRRVSAADRYDARAKALAAAAVASGTNPLVRLAAIHTNVGRRIRWRRDLDTYHVADYWAQASETLTRGQGDDEDIAILKMQVLKAAGFSPRDIYVSVGHDRWRGADSCCWFASEAISTLWTIVAQDHCVQLAQRASSRSSRSAETMPGSMGAAWSLAPHFANG